MFNKVDNNSRYGHLLCNWLQRLDQLFISSNIIKFPCVQQDNKKKLENHLLKVQLNLKIQWALIIHNQKQNSPGIHYWRVHETGSCDLGFSCSWFREETTWLVKPWYFKFSRKGAKQIMIPKDLQYSK